MEAISGREPSNIESYDFFTRKVRGEEGWEMVIFERRTKVEYSRVFHYLKDASFTLARFKELAQSKDTCGFYNMLEELQENDYLVRTEGK